MKRSFGKKTKYLAPLYQSVCDYVDQKNVRFHMPSHKGYKFSKLYNGSDFDITELDFSDNLLSADGVIKQSEELLARFFCVDNAFMFTSGSTTALFSSLFVAKAVGGKILLSKNSHKSIFNAIAILGIEPVFCEVDYDEYGFPIPITANQISYYIQNDDDIKSVLITTPDYFGRVCELDEIRKVCSDKLLISDSAHGAHFAFTQDLTQRAELIADICVMSMHKTLPCFTGSAIATCKNKWSDLLKKGRQLFHTSSPYYPSMISMDYVRAYFSNNSKECFASLKKEIQSFDRLKTYDYTKLLLKGGKKLSDFLIQNGIYPECVFGDYVLCIALPWDMKGIKKLKRVLAKFKYSASDSVCIPSNVNGDRKVAYNDVIFRECEWINLEKSQGRISAGEIGLYPPGTPIIIRGEIIDEIRLKILLNNKNNLFGVDSNRVCVLK